MRLQVFQHGARYPCRFSDSRLCLYSSGRSPFRLRTPTTRPLTSTPQDKQLDCSASPAKETAAAADVSGAAADVSGAVADVSSAAAQLETLGSFSAPHDDATPQADDQFSEASSSSSSRPASGDEKSENSSSNSIAGDQEHQQQPQEHPAHQPEAQMALFSAKELKRVWLLALPLMINNIAGYALSIVGAVYIGRLGALPLSASVLANSVYNCTGLSIAIGLSAGMETLCGQAYGAGAYTRVGVVLQRALLVCWTICLPVGFLWAQSYNLLLQLGQQPEIAILASRYLFLCIPCLFLTTTMECIRRYLQAQRAVKPAMAVAAVTLAASPFFFWLLVEQLQMGLDGAAIAFISCQVSTLAGLLGYVMFRAWKQQGKREQTWGGFSSEAFKGWGEYCSYGLPAAAMIVLEWWAYEVVILMAGLLPDASIALSTMGICLNINAWMYMLPLGLGAAVNTSISNALGAGHAATAKRAFVGGIVSGLLLQSVLSAVVVTWGPQMVQLFTNEPSVIQCCCTVLPLLAILIFCDGVTAVVAGVLRGSGRQLLGAAVNFIGYFVVGVPLAAYLAFNKGMGVNGFWLGVGAGAFLQAGVLLAILCRWDWNKEVQRVQLLLKGSGLTKIKPSFGH